MSNIAIYPKGTTDFFSQGYGILSDVVSSETTETASTSGNVSSKLEMQYPVNGYLSDKLIEGNFIRVSMSKDSNDYAIYEITDSLKEDTGTITIYGDPYSDRIGRMSFEHGGQFPVKYPANSVLSQSINDIKDFPAWFKVSTDITKQVDLSEHSPYENFSKFLDELNTKVSGKVKYGVNYIRIYSDLGSDRTDIVLRDDMNTTSVKIKTDYSSIVNRIIPLINNKDENGNVSEGTHLGTIVTSDNPHEFIDYWAGSVITVDSQDLANTYFNRTHVNRPTQTVTVTPIDYDKDLANIHLFDRLTVYSSKLGFSSKLRVSERVIDNLTGEVITFKLGDTSPSIVKTITERNEQLFNQVQQISNAVVSANQKNTTYHGNAEPSTPIEGDLWYKEEDGETYLQIYQNGEWIDVVSTKTQKLIEDSVNSALLVAHSEAAAMDEQNNISINNAINEVSQEKIDLALKDADFNGKAQAMADKALSDAKANTTTVAQETLNSANQNIADAKKSLSDSISSEASARTQAVANIGSQAQTYANQAKSDAIAAATTADGVVRKDFKTTTDSLSSTISQNKKDSDGRISTAQTTATQALNGLETKVSKTDYDQTTGDLSTKVNTVTQTANETKNELADISKTVGSQSSKINTISNTVDGTTQAISDIQTEQGKQSGSIATLQSRADGFDATVTKVNNLSVGGRNYVLGTKNALSWSGTGMNNQASSDSDPTNAYTMNRSALGSSVIISYDLTIDSDMPSTASVGLQFYSYPSWDQLVISGAHSSGTYRFSKAYSIPSDTKPTQAARIRGIANGYTGNISISNVKIEIGTVATDWSPAPEDLSSATAKAQLTADNATLSINNYKTDADGRIKKAQADIEVNANEIKQKVSQSVYDKKTGDLTKSINEAKSTADTATQTIGTYKETNDRRIDSAETKIKANSDAIKLTISKTDFDEETGKLSGDISTLQESAKGFEATVAKVDNLSVGGTNLVSGTNQEYKMGYGIPNTTWQDGYAYLKLPTNIIYSEILPQSPHTFSYTLVQETTYTQTIWFETDAAVKDLSVAQITWFTGTEHDIQPAIIQKLGQNSYKVVSTYMWPGKTDNNVRLFDIKNLDSAFDFNTGTYLKFGKLKLEKGNIPTDWTPATEDTDNKISTVSQKVDEVSSIVSDPTTGLTKRVQTAEGTLEKVTGADIPALQNATFWQPYSSLDFNSYTKQGSFFFNTTSAKTNGPTASTAWTYLIVEQGTADNNRIKQTAWYDGVNGVKITYVRTRNDSTWSPWYANDNDSVATISQTNESIKREIKDRKDGDDNTFESSKNFTTSSITKYDEGVQSKITQTANGILANIGATNLFPNTEFNTDYGWRSKNGNVIYFLNQNIDGQYHGVVRVVSTAASYQGYWARNIPVQGGSKYSGSVRVHFDNNGIGTGKAFYDLWFVAKDGSRISQGTGASSARNIITMISSPYWIDLWIDGITAPINAVYAQVSLIVNDAGTGMTADFTMPTFTATDVHQPYSPNDDITTQLALLKDNWSIGITNNTGALINGINGDGSNVRIAAKKLIIDQDVTIGGTGWLNGAVIKYASIGSAQIGTIDASDGKIINLDVKYLSGDSTNFIKSKWKSAFTNVDITGDGMSIGAGRSSITMLSDGIHMAAWNSVTNKTELVGGLRMAKLNTAGNDYIDYLTLLVDGYETLGSGQNAVNGGDGFAVAVSNGKNDDSKMKLSWESERSAKARGVNYGWNFWDPVTFRNPYINVPGAYQGLRIENVKHANGTIYPAIVGEARGVGILFGSTELYLMRNNRAYALGDILTGTKFNI